METLIHKTDMTRLFEMGDDGIIIASAGNDDIYMECDEAIAAARAILKHFNVDYNAYEENILSRYRALTPDEMKDFLAENPNIIPIPEHIYDPDAPLTSELSGHFGEE